MLDTYDETQEFVKGIFLAKEEKGKIQKIFSSYQIIDFVIRFKGETKHIYLGRGGGCIGMALGAKQLPARTRIRDRFLEYLRKYLKNAYVTNVVVDKNDNIFAIEYKGAEYQGIISFFWKSKLLYFSNRISLPEALIYKSWKGKDCFDEKLALFREFDSVGRFQSEKKRPYNLFLKEENCLIDNEQVDHKSANKKAKSLEKKRDKIEQDLARVKTRDVLKEDLESGLLDLGPSELRTRGFCFKFYGIDNIHHKKDIIYKKIKSLKIAEQILEKRLTKVKSELTSAQGKDVVSKETDKKVIQPCWRDDERDLVVDNDTSDIKIYSFNDGSLIAVGLNAQGNDYLRNTWGEKNNMWFHEEGEKGAHVVCKLASDWPINKLADYVATIVFLQKNSNSDQIRLVYTALKNIRGIKGRRGAVTIKNPRYISGKILQKNDWKMFLPIEDN